jgi:hypothetical protein
MAIVARRSRRTVGAVLFVAAGTFGVLALGVDATAAHAQSVCYDDQGNVVPCPTVPTTTPPVTQPPPTLPPATTAPPATSPPATAPRVTPPPTSPPVTVQQTSPPTNRRTNVPVAPAPATAPTPTATTAPATTSTTATVETTTTTVVALAVGPLAKVDPPHSGTDHRGSTLALIAIVALLLIVAILGPELRAWFDRNHPRTL